MVNRRANLHRFIYGVCLYGSDTNSWTARRGREWWGKGRNEVVEAKLGGGWRRDESVLAEPTVAYRGLCSFTYLASLRITQEGWKLPALKQAHKLEEGDRHHSSSRASHHEEVARLRRRICEYPADTRHRAGTTLL